MSTLPLTDRSPDTGPFVQDSSALREVAATLLGEALAHDATDAVAHVSEAESLSATVRGGALDEVEQSRSGGASVTVFFDGRYASVGTSDLSSAGLKRAAVEACRIARWAAPDECSGPAEEALLETGPRDLDLYHPWQPTVEEAAQRAREAEQAARDIRGEKGKIVDSSATVSASHRQFVLMTSRGFTGGLASSSHSASCMVIASHGGRMQSGDWRDARRRSEALTAAGAIGRTAALRTFAMLDARALSTRQCPVLFEAPIAGALIDALVDAVSGHAQYTRQTFLPQPLGQIVLAEHLSLEEEAHQLGGRASKPFDGEGVRTSDRTVVQDGVLKGWFLSCYSARRLKLHSTGHADGRHNLILKSRETRSEHSLSAMLAMLGTGLFVTQTMGQGLNPLTGDYSVGAAGFWVEGGRIQHPVEGITIAGNLKSMLRNIVAVGADTDDGRGIATGSILVDRMTVAGT